MSQCSQNSDGRGLWETKHLSIMEILSPFYKEQRLDQISNFALLRAVNDRLPHEKEYT